jgi:hypothetical protein
MPDDPTKPPQPNPPVPPASSVKPAVAPAAPADIGHMPMSEEFDSAKWTLPPIVPVLIAAAAVAVIVAIVMFTNRPTPILSGSIAKVAAADMDANTLVAVKLQLNNVIDKQIWIKGVTSELETADGKKYKDSAAPSGDVPRYMQAAPALAEAEAEPIKAELKIPARTSYIGSAVFSYPVDKKTFDARKGLTIRVQIYDQPTVVLKQP